jgi:hypothetical protein
VAAKAALAAAVPLVHPQSDAALALATDASDTHIGSVLQQQVSGHWQPLGFFFTQVAAGGGELLHLRPGAAGGRPGH